MFWELFPEYIVAGMTFDMYWNMSPVLAVSYREAYKLRREEQNFAAWWQGAYVLEAMSVIASRLTSKKSINYPDKPHRITPLSAKEKAEQKEAEIKANQEKLINMLNAMKADYDRKWKTSTSK